MSRCYLCGSKDCCGADPKLYVAYEMYDALTELVGWQTTAPEEVVNKCLKVLEEARGEV